MTVNVVLHLVTFCCSTTVDVKYFKRYRCYSLQRIHKKSNYCRVMVFKFKCSVSKQASSSARVLRRDAPCQSSNEEWDVFSPAFKINMFDSSIDDDCYSCCLLLNFVCSVFLLSIEAKDIQGTTYTLAKVKLK